MMEISNMQQHQAMVSQLDQALSCPNSQQQQQQQEKKPRPNPEQALKCPRCDSTNTKFCYYNNYSLTQPRYFCKGCRRYWTKGGTLRNVPIGGGCRKNKRSSTTSSSKRSQEKDLIAAPLLPPLPLPPLSFDPHDLSLAFALDNHDNFPTLPNPNPNPTFLDILRNGLNINTNPSEGMYYGFGDHNAIPSGDGIMMFPFDGGLMSSSEAMTTTTIEATTTMTTNASSVQGSHCKVLDQGGESKVVMGLHNWPIGGDHGSLGLDSARDYWNGIGSNWHGLIDSSLM